MVSWGPGDGFVLDVEEVVDVADPDRRGRLPVAGLIRAAWLPGIKATRHCVAEQGRRAVRLGEAVGGDRRVLVGSVGGGHHLAWGGFAKYARPHEYARIFGFALRVKGIRLDDDFGVLAAAMLTGMSSTEGAISKSSFATKTKSVRLGGFGSLTHWSR